MTSPLKYTFTALASNDPLITDDLKCFDIDDLGIDLADVFSLFGKPVINRECKRSDNGGWITQYVWYIRRSDGVGCCIYYNHQDTRFLYSHDEIEVEIRDFCNKMVFNK